MQILFEYPFKNKHFADFKVFKLIGICFVQTYGSRALKSRGSYEMPTSSFEGDGCRREGVGSNIVKKLLTS